MKFTYYVFPDNVSEEIRAMEGCAVWIVNHDTPFYPEDGLKSKPENMILDHVEYRIQCSVISCKKLIRKYGGHGYTLHIDRDGSIFETSFIKLKGNNSRVRYNHHL